MILKRVICRRNNDRRPPNKFLLLHNETDEETKYWLTTSEMQLGTAIKLRLLQ